MLTAMPPKLELPLRLVGENLRNYYRMIFKKYMATADNWGQPWQGAEKCHLCR
jgi:hypothetical protein